MGVVFKEHTEQNLTTDTWDFKSTDIVTLEEKYLIAREVFQRCGASNEMAIDYTVHGLLIDWFIHEDAYRVSPSIFVAKCGDVTVKDVPDVVIQPGVVANYVWGQCESCWESLIYDRISNVGFPNHSTAQNGHKMDDMIPKLIEFVRMCGGSQQVEENFP